MASSVKYDQLSVAQSLIHRKLRTLPQILSPCSNNLLKRQWILKCPQCRVDQRPTRTRCRRNRGWRRFRCYIGQHRIPTPGRTPTVKTTIVSQCKSLWVLIRIPAKMTTLIRPVVTEEGAYRGTTEWSAPRLIYI